LLATSFPEKIAQRMGRTIAPLSLSSIRRLKSYDWPGNIRKNVIERAVITSRDGTLNLVRALPETKEVQNEAMQISDKDNSCFLAKYRKLFVIFRNFEVSRPPKNIQEWSKITDGGRL